MGGKRYADEFARKGLCVRVIREAAPTCWWIPATTYAVHRDGLGPGRYGRVGASAHCQGQCQTRDLPLGSPLKATSCALRRRFTVGCSSDCHLPGTGHAI